MHRKYTLEDDRPHLLTGGHREGECLLWDGRLDKDGYGAIGRGRRVHVVSYRLFKGPISSGLQVQHSCNIRRCYEPIHLSLGTHKRNSEHMVASGHSTQGSANRHAKLSEAEVAEIRRLRVEGMKQRELAALFSVSQPLISYLLNHGWSHVTTS